MADPTRFTQHATHVIRQAELEARLLRARSVEAEHLLIALCAEDAGVGATVLHEDLRLDPEQIRSLVAEVSAKFSPAMAEANGDKPPRAPSFTDALYWAGQEALDAHHHYIGTEHLLLGLAASSDKPMREIFQRLNLRPEEIRAQVHGRVPEIPLQANRRARLKDRARTEFYHNFAYYIPQPIRKLFGRFLDSSQMPPLG
ncbi:MAG TPA: Clp protease N-terminal domain-containing protein [Phototrophicaceae bacterium]|nr:Clp protease N-terminal domain-containing protein [Phototrophicaceae bacterium]